MTRQKLSDEDIRKRLEARPGWQLQNGKLHREFRFPSFVEAFGFMCKVALHAERMNHHPELVNVYREVTIGLSTHDAGGVSEMDFRLAEAIDALL